MLDGQPIRAVLTLESANVKTGNMAQLWILRDDIEPHLAIKSGADASICGDCPQRPVNGGGCYVVTWRGPLGVYRSTLDKPQRLWRAVAALRVRRALTPDFKATLRLGAYGDPAAVPAPYLKALVKAVDGRVTGYTHQWRNPTFRPLAHFLMASVESPRDQLIAKSRGWRTFRVAPSMATLGAREIECLSESKGLTCAACGLCAGMSKPAASIAIAAHGFTVKRATSKVEA